MPQPLEHKRQHDRALLLFGAGLLLLASPLRTLWAEGPVWLPYVAWVGGIVAAGAAARRQR